MKKIIALLLATVCIFGLFGCSSKEENVDVQVPTDETESVTEEIQTPNNNNQEETGEDEEEEIVDPSIINMAYFTIKLPESWVDAYVAEIGEDSYLALYEKDSFENHERGLLVTIRIMPEEFDHTQFPESIFLGTVNIERGKCKVIVMYPTDVQFVNETKDKYNKMNKELQTIIDGIQFKDSANFQKAH